MCPRGMILGNLISALNPALGEVYKRDRWQSGTAGIRYNYGAPKGFNQEDLGHMG
jgi:hypothetical protein